MRKDPFEELGFKLSEVIVLNWEKCWAKNVLGRRNGMYELWEFKRERNEAGLRQK